MVVASIWNRIWLRQRMTVDPTTCIPFALENGSSPSSRASIGSSTIEFRNQNRFISWSEMSVDQIKWKRRVLVSQWTATLEGPFLGKKALLFVYALHIHVADVCYSALKHNATSTTFSSAVTFFIKFYSILVLGLPLATEFWAMWTMLLLCHYYAKAIPSHTIFHSQINLFELSPEWSGTL